MKDCRSCEFFRGRVEKKHWSCYLCLHPITLQLEGGKIYNLRGNCVLHVKKRRKKKEE